ncbi:hypothetical protein [Actinosynnema sp. NPDC023587]|uniref:hypothetical protein n=1 Tax=Actinosynnema sp. NPDC023587 TaxID=3154695 RepID=UPI0033F6ACD7
MTTTIPVTGPDFEVEDTTTARTVRLTQAHIDGGRLPLPRAVREQLAPDVAITVTLTIRPGRTQAGAWRTEQQCASLTGITWPIEIVPGTRADIAVQRTGGCTRRVHVTVDAPESAPTRRRRTRAKSTPPVTPAVSDSEVVSREVVATATVTGGTRVIEFAVIRRTHGCRSWSTYRVTAYDSNHNSAHHSVGIGPADTPDQIADARTNASTLLTPGQDPEYCDCWSGWDPYCGKAACWGVYTCR